MCCSGGKNPLIEFPVAIERVGPLVVDPREVVDLELDAGNCVAQRFMT